MKPVINVWTRLVQVAMSLPTLRAWATTTRLDLEMKRIINVLDQACPGEDVALDINGLDKNITPRSGDETHHQRLDQACPGSNVALDTKRLDKNNMPRPEVLLAAINTVNAKWSAAGKKTSSDLDWFHHIEENYGAELASMMDYTI